MAEGGQAPWVKFSQSEDLTTRLRNILHDYAFGPGVFRELLQNADDAGARRLVLLADGRRWAAGGGGGGLLDPRLEPWQGPAVLAFNDAEFSDADFEGICRVGASGKRGDSSKIGQYGLGFNATYHLSDVVSFVSRDRLCIFDPHAAHLPSDLPGLQLRLGASEQRQYAAQLAPFEAAARAAGATTWPLAGAIFRLPLRTPALAAKSQISADSHSFQELVGVLHELVAHAHELLLFLQSVEAVEVLLVDEGAAPSAAPRRLGSASLRAASDAAVARLRQERRLFSAPSVDGGSLARSAYTFALDERRSDGSECSSAWLVLARSEDAAGGKASGKASGKAAAAPASKLLEEVPKRRCAAVALRLWPPAAEAPVAGGAFCYLPLSIATGLPAHASANFALTANRRDLWRRSDDREESAGNRRAAWNEALLTGTVPRVYADLLEIRAALHSDGGGRLDGFGRDLLAALPPGPWAEALAARCAAAELWACVPGAAHGPFEALPPRIAEELFARDLAVLWDRFREQFVTPKAAMLCSEEESRRLPPPLQGALRRLADSSARRGVVEVPGRLCEVLREVKGATWLGPQSLATALRGANPELEVAEVDAVVEYLLGPMAAGPLTALLGLRLCPLIGGGLARFGKPPGQPEGQPELWWTEDAELSGLLPGRPFVDPTSGVFRLLAPRIANAGLNVRLLSHRALQELLPSILPACWQGCRVVSLAGGQLLVDGESAAALQERADRAATAAESAARSAALRGGRRGQAKAAGKPKKGGGGSKANKRGGGRAQFADDWDDYADAYDEDDDAYEEVEEPAAVAAAAAAAGEAPRRGVVTQAELPAFLRRCALLWRAVDRGNAPAQLVTAAGDFPCIPVEQPLEGWGSRPAVLLISSAEAAKRHLLSVEDFSAADRATLERLGLTFARPALQLRRLWQLSRTTLLPALRALFAERWAATGNAAATGESARLFMGLKDHRLPIEDARPLRDLLRTLYSKNLIPKETEALERLPIFETQGGRYCVPLLPEAARVLPPDEAWDEALRPAFADYLVAFDGDAGDFLQEVGRDRAATLSFLADFVAPRVGLLEAELCVRFLEGAAAAGKALFCKAAAPRHRQLIAQACMNAPLVVFPSGERRRIAELADPTDATLQEVMGGSSVFPPELYCTPVVLSVMREAGLLRFSDPSVFLKVAHEVALSGDVGQCRALLQHLGRLPEVMKWPSPAFKQLAHLPIFPAFVQVTGAIYPPTEVEAPPGHATSLVSLDAPCLFEHGHVSWTQAPLLDPAAVGGWPKPLRRRFGILKDPPPQDLVTSNLAEAAARWGAVPTTEASLVRRRQAIVGAHLKSLAALKRAKHATQTMVQSRLASSPFIVLDDGRLVRASDVFRELHSGGDSDGEYEVEDLAELHPDDGDEGDEGGEGGEGEEAEGRAGGWAEARPGRPRAAGEARAAEARQASGRGAAKGAKAAAASGQPATPWALPGYLRPHRRLLLGIAGPTVNTKEKAPQVRVPAAPEADAVPQFLERSLNQPELADVEFVVASEDGSETSVYAHRLVLAAASEHFRKTFTGALAMPLGAGGRCRLEMPEWVTSMALLWMLAYFYKGFDPEKAQSVALFMEAKRNCDGSAAAAAAAARVGKKQLRQARQRVLQEAEDDIGEHLCCLLRLSEFYCLEHLKAWCESRLEKLLAPENLVAVSTHAFFCNARQLLRVCVYNMRLIYAEFAGQEEWQSLEPRIKELVLADEVPAGEV